VKVTTEVLERCETLLTVEVEPKQEQKMLQQAAKRIAREVNIPGFRPGKAPYNVIVRRFGLDVVQQEAIEKSADKLIQEALAEVEITPYAQIGLDNIDWEPLTIKLKVPTEPKVEIGDYRETRLEFEPVTVTDEDIEKELKDIQEQNASWAPVERGAEIGDMIDISVVEKDGDEVLEERESEEFVLEDPEEHEGHDHPDMTTPLLGLSADEEKTFTLTYSDDYDNDTYAGKEITFEVKVNAVKQKEVDPIDDEFAQSFSDFDTLEELKADIHRQSAGTT
jgi:trigger factor